MLSSPYFPRCHVSSPSPTALTHLTPTALRGRYAAEGIDIWLTWGRSGVAGAFELSEEAVALGGTFRAFLVGFARTASLEGSGGWKPFPSVCEYGADGAGVTCSEENAHARACAIYGAGAGSKFELEIG